MSNKIIFITGGARSGKSSFALAEASNINGPKAYVATAQALDDEMKERIEKHRNDRPRDWDTHEEPVNISAVLKEIKGKYSAVVLDCLTLWLSNLMHQPGQPEKAIEEFIDKLEEFKISSSVHHPSSILMVSNEVGMGVVPDNDMAREFRDLAGFLNQKAAETADEVYLVTAGIPIKIKDQK